MTDYDLFGLALSGAVVVILFAYLGYALTHPEKF